MRGSSTGRARRWAVVVVGLLVLCALPSVVAAIPVGDSAVTATTLLARIRDSRTTPYSGFVDARGSLALPDLPRAGDLGQLLGGTSRLRVWWAGPHRWRVDTLSLIGETDLYADADGTLEWDNQRDRVTRVYGEQALRSPRSTDLVPPELGRRLAAPATAREVARLPARRIAGRSCLGLRITPAERATTIGHIDIWADRGTGLPLQVAVSARGAETSSVSAKFLDVKLSAPPAGVTALQVPESATFFTQQAPDLASAIDRFSPYALPARLAGLARQPRVDTLGGTGGAATYGAGYTLLALLPLPDDIATRALDALAPPNGEIVKVPGADAAAADLSPIEAVVVGGDDGSYLLAGTVPRALLVGAATQLVRSPPKFRDGR